MDNYATKFCRFSRIAFFHFRDPPPSRPVKLLSVKILRRKRRTVTTRTWRLPGIPRTASWSGPRAAFWWLGIWAGKRSERSAAWRSERSSDDYRSCCCDYRSTKRLPSCRRPRFVPFRSMPSAPLRPYNTRSCRIHRRRPGSCCSVSGYYRNKNVWKNTK